MKKNPYVELCVMIVLTGLLIYCLLAFASAIGLMEMAEEMGDVREMNRAEMQMLVASFVGVVDAFCLRAFTSSCKRRRTCR